MSSKVLDVDKVNIKVLDYYKEYEFITPWIALNQKNIEKYKSLDNYEKEEFLKRILIGNILSFAKSFNIFIEEKLSCEILLEEEKVQSKNINYISFKGKFKTNIEIPELIGLGKSVAKGFGTIIKL